MYLINWNIIYYESNLTEVNELFNDEIQTNSFVVMESTVDSS